MIKKILKKFRYYKPLRAYYSVLRSTFKNYPLSKKILELKCYFLDLKNYKKLNQNKNKNFKIDWDYIAPQIRDKTKNSPIEPVYFYQDSWCARKIFENIPKHHYDIGSKAEMIGIISQFTHTTMVDIRPIDLKIKGLDFIKGDILALPFKDKSIESLSSICVIEHIGLGRYGDALDPFGSEKAIKELKRVLSHNGSLYVSVPVNNENRIYFNAHRAFTRNSILELFKPLKLIEEKYIYGRQMYDNYDANEESGTGLYHFKKIT